MVGSVDDVFWESWMEFWLCSVSFRHPVVVFTGAVVEHQGGTLAIFSTHVGYLRITLPLNGYSSRTSYCPWSLRSTPSSMLNNLVTCGPHPHRSSAAKALAPASMSPHHQTRAKAVDSLTQLHALVLIRQPTWHFQTALITNQRLSNACGIAAAGSLRPSEA